MAACRYCWRASCLAVFTACLSTPGPAVKIAPTLRLRTPASLRGSANAGSAIALRPATADDSSPALELVGCRLSGHPAASGAGGDGATAPAFVYGPELCPAAHHDACRASFGCRKNKAGPPGRCSAADLGTWPAASMRMWVTVSGTPDTPRCAYAATSGVDTVMVFDADGVTYASLGLAQELGGSKDVVVGASAHVKPAFTDDGATMLTALIAGKCGDDDAGCTATCRALVGRGYGNAQAASTSVAVQPPGAAPAPAPAPGGAACPLFGKEAAAEASTRDLERELFKPLHAMLRERTKLIAKPESALQGRPELLAEKKAGGPLGKQRKAAEAKDHYGGRKAHPRLSTHLVRLSRH